MFKSLTKIVFSVVAVFVLGAGLMSQIALGDTLSNTNAAIVEEVAPTDGGNGYGGGG